MAALTTEQRAPSPALVAPPVLVLAAVVWGQHQARVVSRAPLVGVMEDRARVGAMASQGPDSRCTERLPQAPGDMDRGSRQAAPSE